MKHCRINLKLKREFGLYDDKGRYTSYKSLKRRYIKQAHKLVDAYVFPQHLEEKVAVCNAQMSFDEGVA